MQRKLNGMSNFPLYHEIHVSVINRRYHPVQMASLSLDYKRFDTLDKRPASNT